MKKYILAAILTLMCSLAFAQKGDGWRVVNTYGHKVFIVTIDSNRVEDKHVYQNAIDNLCNREWCNVLFWEVGNAGSKTVDSKMTDRESRTQIGAYIQNRSTGFQSQTWRCDAVPGTDQEGCFRD